MTITTKRNLVLFCLDILTFIVGFSGFLCVLGSAGALEHFTITCSQFIIRGLIGIGMMCSSVLIYKLRIRIFRYFKYISKK